MELKDIGLTLFAYNFPHKKTQDFIFRILSDGYKINLIIAADPVKLNIPDSTIRTKVRHAGLIHPKDIAKSFDIRYEVIAHDNPTIVDIVKSSDLKMGIISGARILKKPIIEAFKDGIINYHPGLIPESRGLDASLWSIANSIPLGVTAHLIDHRVDAGKILEKKKIKILKDDTLFDLSERLYDVQLDMIKAALENALAKNYYVPVDFGVYNKKMPPDLENSICEKLNGYLIKYGE